MSRHKKRLTAATIGQTAARNYLISIGHRIIEENYYVRWGEIDIISRDTSNLVFVEVRTKRRPYRVNPIISISPKKIQTVVRAAKRYMLLHNIVDAHPRLDCVGVVLGENDRIESIDHRINCYTP